MRLLSILFMFVFLVALSPAGFAADEEKLDAVKPQESGQEMIAPQIKKAPKKSDMSDLPDDYIIEASKFSETCRNDKKMPLYYNCECLAVEYLDHRKDLGPDASKEAVKNRLGDHCKDGTGIAGQLYEKCLYDYATAPKHVDPEEFCSCYGNTFASLFEKSRGALYPQIEISFLSKARLKCSNPEAARKIYGNF